MTTVRDLGVIFVMLVLAGCATAQSSGSSIQASSGKLAIPADLQPLIVQSIALGREIYLQDKAAAVGTDVLIDRLGSIENKGLGGYLTVREGDVAGTPLSTWINLFFTQETPPRIAYRVRVPIGQEEQPEFIEVSPPEAVASATLALIHARQAALEAAGPFSQSINPVVFPGEAIDEDGILVLLLAATVKPNVAVLGRHYRVLVSKNGQTVKKVLPLSREILELPTVTTAGGLNEALVVTHFVTDYPVETHVFASMLHGIPILVSTRRGIWLVSGDEIYLVSNEVPGGAQ
jgi:hypothetical protein